MPTYDLSDPYDLDIMCAEFDGYSADDWQEYVEIAKERKIGFKEVGMLMTASKKARLSKYLSHKQVLWALNLVDKLDKIIEDDEKDDKAEETLKSSSYKMPKSNLTLRVAWHDNKWNGHICNDPENNTYCNGFHSLLSERIRKRKDENLEQEILHSGKALKDIDYLPPCFWSINLFGNDPMKAKHDNPAAPDLKVIEEELPAHSMYSWPFAVSFTRSQKEQSESGAYPKNLESTRIPRFNAKLYEDQSIGIMYAKYSNPLTEEEQQYLVVGAGIINHKQKANEIPHFGPESEIETIRSRPYKNYKNRNFPSMNWAMQFSFDDYGSVRMPYHEYLAEAEQLSDEDKEGFFDKIKVAITEPELEWCFKYVAMDIGDDETIYVLTKMRKSLIACLDDGIVPREEMQERIEKVEGLVEMAWSSRSCFPGFAKISRVIMHQQNEPDFPLEAFYEDFKLEEDTGEEALLAMLQKPKAHPLSKQYKKQIEELKDRLDQYGLDLTQLLQLSLLNLKPFQFQRILQGKLSLSDTWIRNFDDDVKRSHDTSSIIKNPYLLYEDYDYWPDSHDDVYGEELDAPIDLFKIDIAYFPDTKIVSRIGLQRQMTFVDKRRIRALILRYLKTLENSGDCFASAEILQDAISNYPLYYESGNDYILPPDLFHPIKSNYAVHFKEEPSKLVIVEANNTSYYYLSNVFNAEELIEKKFMQLLLAPENEERYPNLGSELNNSVAILKSRIGDSFDKSLFLEEREELYEHLFAKKLFVVAGSAGSGKSYEVLKIISYLEKELGQKYLLLAPTGKAALRLSSDKDFENIKASTLDKFINDVKNKKISYGEVAEYKNIIIDETSMVDLLKFERLLNIFNFEAPSFKRLILIGDPNQLPAIGYGKVLSDTISFFNSKSEYNSHYTQLESNCRTELKDSDVLRLADGFKANTKNDIDEDILNKFESKQVQISNNFRARYWTNKDELFAQIKEEFLELTKPYKGTLDEKLNQILGLSSKGKLLNEFNVENFQILTPYKSEYAGASRINDYIQSVFKSNLPYKLRKNVFKESDKLIRTKNYYHKKQLALSNGSLGFIKKNKEEVFIHESQDDIKEMPFKSIRTFEQEFFELAYAITVHKSQGSGFNHLFLVLPARYGLLSKELVYTALTRTKQSITLFIQDSAHQRTSILEKAQQRSFSSSRRTSLMLDKPYRYYDLEPESGVYVASRVELLIYLILQNKKKHLGGDLINFAYEQKPIIEGKELNIKTDFTIYVNNKIWYWEHLGLLSQRKYRKTWQNLKTKNYKEAGIWDSIITTDERNGINNQKIEQIVDLLINDKVDSEDRHNQYSNHHYYLR